MSGLSHYALADQLLDTAEMTHEGQPADTNIAEAHVRALLAVAERLGEIAEILRTPSVVDAFLDQVATGPIPVRIDSFIGISADTAAKHVMHPHWNGGEPVRVLSVRTAEVGDGLVTARYKAEEWYSAASVIVPADTLVTPA